MGTRNSGMSLLNERLIEGFLLSFKFALVEKSKFDHEGWILRKVIDGGDGMENRLWLLPTQITRQFTYYTRHKSIKFSGPRNDRFTCQSGQNGIFVSTTKLAQQLDEVAEPLSRLRNK